jgi:hypothetical protein
MFDNCLLNLEKLKVERDYLRLNLTCFGGKLAPLGTADKRGAKVVQGLDNRDRKGYFGGVIFQILLT